MNSVTNQQAADKLTKARSVMVLDHPFFASLALRLKFIEDKDCETAWTDGEFIGYNPDFIEALTFKKTLFVVGHETLHPGFLHNFRRDERDFQQWNEACDYAINGILKGAGFDLVDGALIDSKYDGLSAEEIFKMIPAKPKGKNGQGQGQGKGGKGLDKNGDVGGCGVCRDAKPKGGKGKGKGKGKGQGQTLDNMAQDWKLAAQQAKQQAKAMGSLPGGIDRVIKDMVDPKASWQDLLYRFVDSFAKNDYSWSPPNRRFIHKGMYFPSLYSEEIGKLFFVLDTSGSITDIVENQFASEVNAALEAFPTLDITVLYVDTKVAGVEYFTADQRPITLDVKGGGGTDFRPPFKWIEENEADLPVALIYLTDLECSRFPDEPPFPVLWAHIGNGSKDVPFGEVIEVKD